MTPEERAKEAAGEILSKAELCEITDDDDLYTGLYFKDDEGTPDDELIEDMYEERVFIPIILSAIEAATAEQDAQIKKLRDQISLHKYDKENYREEVEHLKAQIAKLLAVIEPFAKVAENWDPSEDDNLSMRAKECPEEWEDFTMGDFRAAAKIHKEVTGG